MVILGASIYPRKPDWSNPALGTSAEAFCDYIISRSGMSLPVEQMLNLFDDPLPAAKQCEHVETFLLGKNHARDLILYYIGHGGFDEEEYYLGVRDTADNREFITAIESRKIARIVHERFGRKRVYVILDSCFAASAASDWMGTALEAAVKRMSSPLPKKGTAFLAASSKDKVALAPRNNRYTVFTGALLQSLQRGIQNGAEKLSLYDLYEEIRATLNEQEDLGRARPELYAPRQQDGDISRLPLFPNEAWIKARKEAEQHARKEAQTIADAEVRAIADAEVRAIADAKARVITDVEVRTIAARREQDEREQAAPAAPEPTFVVNWSLLRTADAEATSVESGSVVPPLDSALHPLKQVVLSTPPEFVGTSQPALPLLSTVQLTGSAVEVPPPSSSPILEPRFDITKAIESQPPVSSPASAVHAQSRSRRLLRIPLAMAGGRALLLIILVAVPVATAGFWYWRSRGEFTERSVAVHDAALEPPRLTGLNTSNTEPDAMEGTENSRDATSRSTPPIDAAPRDTGAIVLDAGSVQHRQVDKSMNVQTLGDKAAEAKVLYDKAYEDLGEGDFKRAFERAEASLKLRKTARTYLLLAQTQLRLERIDDALASVEAAAQIAPQFASVWELRGRILWIARRRDEARVAFSQFLTLEPTGPRAEAVQKLMNEPH